ncbi:MAG: RNA-protein complex protein Nop10 [Thermoplasmata archaeon]
MNRIKKCSRCGRYTLSDQCPECGGKTINPKPPKYSPEDRYGSYRREQKKKHSDRKG